MRQIRLICFRTERRAAGTGNSTIVLSAPEMSQLLEAATRLFLFMCHSVIQESGSKALPKGTDIFSLSPPACEAALPEAGGFELPGHQLCWIVSIRGVDRCCRDSIPFGEPWEAIPDVIQPSYYGNKEISGRKLLRNPPCLR